jgi:hypothetical protein
MDRIEELALKLRQLASKDTQFKTFGSRNYGGHEYRLNPPASVREVQQFESEFEVELPDDYKEFLLKIGNGGAGPYYGLYSLNDAVSDDPFHKSRAFLSAHFPLEDAFNPYSESATDDEIFDDKYIAGSIILAHQGCGYYDRLVISGPQRGQVWTDARVSDQGIVPLNCDFYGWYDCWLIDSLATLGS